MRTSIAGAVVRPLPLRRVALAGATLILLAGAVAGCQVGQAPAATVNGHDISAAAVRDDLAAEVAAAKKAAQPGQPAPAVQVVGKGEGTFQSTAAAGKVTARVVDELLRQELERRHLAPTAADRTEAANQLCGNKPGCLDPYPSSYKTFITGLQSRYTAFARTVRSTAAPPKTRSPAELEAAAQTQYDQALAQRPDQLEQVCYVAALVPDAATGEALKGQVAAGGVFATVAAAIPGAQVNATPQCVPKSQEPAPLATVAAGALVGPVADQSGQVVVQVTKRGQAAFADIKDQIVQSLQQQDQTLAQQAGQAQQQDVQRALVKLAGKAHVTVDPRYGSWHDDKVQVTPPTPPKGATATTVPAAAPTAQG